MFQAHWIMYLNLTIVTSLFSSLHWNVNYKRAEAFSISFSVSLGLETEQELNKQSSNSESNLERQVII